MHRGCVFVTSALMVLAIGGHVHPAEPSWKLTQLSSADRLGFSTNAILKPSQDSKRLFVSRDAEHQLVALEVSEVGLAEVGIINLPGRRVPGAIAVSNDGVVVLGQLGGLWSFAETKPGGYVLKKDSPSVPESVKMTPKHAVLLPSGMLYFTAWGENAVWVAKIEDDGSARYVQCIGSEDVDWPGDDRPRIDKIAGLKNPWGLSVSPNGKSLYVCSFKSNAVLHFTIAQGDGSLTLGDSYEIKTVPAAEGLKLPIGVACSLDGKYVYCAGAGDDISVFSRDSGTGGLKHLETYSARGELKNMKGIKAISITPTDGLIVACARSERVLIFQSKAGKLIKQHELQDRAFNGISDAIVTSTGHVCVTSSTAKYALFQSSK